MRQFEPEIAAILSNHRYKKCLFCRDERELGAVIAFCLREPGDPISTAGICVDCARHDDATLVEMTQQEVFPERVARVLEVSALCDELEAEGLLETVGVDPVTGSKIRRLTAKGRERADLLKPEVTMSKGTESKFTPDRFNDNDHELLMAAARLTLRLALHERDSEIDDPNNFFSLFERIENLMAAYVNSEDGKFDADTPSLMLSSFANAVAMTIAMSPPLRAAVADHLASEQDNDP
jgi:hypothetical protein